ncbi:HIT family protein [Candidatus Dojkabacteria bacterium]|nr:HIT family protein [Candidatus Dojkabacteria bacterium]
MHNHAPKNYKCPICLAVDGIENEDTMMKQDDIFYRDDLVMAVVNSKFIKGNEGHVIVFPLKHYENLYDLSEKEANRIMQVAKKVAIAMKEIRNCGGIMIRQNNEPASDQHAFHYHMHIIPRFEGDNFHEGMAESYVAFPEERKPYAEKLRKYFVE